MAINYDLMFGSRSSLTKYNWSNDKYLQGWEMIGVIPPTVQQMDALFRRSDEKDKDLHDRVSYLESLETVADHNANPDAHYNAFRKHNQDPNANPAAINKHNDDVNAHVNAIKKHNDDANAHANAIKKHNDNSAAHANLMAVHNADANANPAAINKHNTDANAHKTQISTAISTHNADANAHTNAIKKHNDDANAHANAIKKHNDNASAHANLMAAHNADANANPAAINKHNTDANAHKTQISTAINTHNADANAHANAIKKHNDDANAHKTQISSAISTHNTDANAHTNAIKKHNDDANAHKTQINSAINTHNTDANAHKTQIASAITTHNDDTTAHSKLGYVSDVTSFFKFDSDDGYNYGTQGVHVLKSDKANHDIVFYNAKTARDDQLGNIIDHTYIKNAELDSDNRGIMFTYGNGRSLTLSLESLMGGLLNHSILGSPGFAFLTKNIIVQYGFTPYGDGMWDDSGVIHNRPSSAYSGFYYVKDSRVIEFPLTFSSVFTVLGASQSGFANHHLFAYIGYNQVNNHAFVINNEGTATERNFWIAIGNTGFAPKKEIDRPSDQQFIIKYDEKGVKVGAYYTPLLPQDAFEYFLENHIRTITTNAGKFELLKAGHFAKYIVKSDGSGVEETDISKIDQSYTIELIRERFDALRKGRMTMGIESEIYNSVGISITPEEADTESTVYIEKYERFPDEILSFGNFMLDKEGNA